VIFDGKGHLFLGLLFKYSLYIDICEGVECSNLRKQASGGKSVKNLLAVEFSKFLYFKV